MVNITADIEIPNEEIEFTFARSGGPGGQNVNKVNSKAVLRWTPMSSNSLPGAVQARFLQRYANRLTTDGELVLSSQKYRDQGRNIDDCLEKLREMIQNVLVPPTPRKATKPSLGSKIRRVESKTQHSERKQQRRRPRIDD
ncbi:MAG: aminoacyl-tRNA hydrolase [Candidatus Obscuribacterales bacterium]|jgi:ribosome-associated protein|nr:aminoacyl-tRNA hydrolase [Candidatus Obscuribacterales bacterium]